MKQILLVGAGHDFPEGAFAFLKTLHEAEPLSVTGLFFSPIDYNALATVSQIPIAAPYLRVKQREKEVVRHNKDLFAGKCKLNYIRHQVHRNEEEWDKEILARESRFSDMILLSGELFYSDIVSNQPNSFLQTALHAAECPVLVVPEKFTPPEHLVIAYDGSKDSLHAMKQFCYLMPQYSDLPTEIIYVKDENSPEIPDIDNLKRFSCLHFSSMNFSKLQFNAANYFAGWIGEKRQVMMVSGSFGRSPFSYVARRRFAQQVIHDHKMPVFIAHT